ncbi:MAG TPA: c-type cytochrome [Burkholderiales bacterium]
MRTLIVLAAIALAGLAGGAVFAWLGIYDISATDQHLRHTYWLLDTSMRRSIKRRAGDIEVPDLSDPAKVQAGAFLYRQHCLQCHGAPGVAPEPFALGMTPVPVPLVHTARAWSPAEMFWVVKEGLKMTGMPAWKYRMSDEHIWAVVAFLPAMARLSPAEFAALRSEPPQPAPEAAHETPDAKRGKRAINQYACVTCHEIPGIVGANAPVGPPLAGIGSRTMLGGVLPNSPENMVRWLREPQELAPLTAMPDLGVTERDARDIAAYLATLK